MADVNSIITIEINIESTIPARSLLLYYIKDVRAEADLCWYWHPTERSSFKPTDLFILPQTLKLSVLG